MLLDFGRLSLQAIKENRYTYTDVEIKSACQSLDIVRSVFFLISNAPKRLYVFLFFRTVRWGFLMRGLTTKGQKRTFYQPVHAAWSEYAAALYLASVSHYANILQREIRSLPLDLEPCLLTSAGIHRSALQVSQLTNQTVLSRIKLEKFELLPIRLEPETASWKSSLRD